MFFFFRGWFDETLPAYEPPAHDRLVVNVDVDLCSSAALVLSSVAPLIRTGSYLYFDKSNDTSNELRAFDEFLKRTHMRFSVIGVSRDLSHVAFIRKC